MSAPVIAELSDQEVDAVRSVVAQDADDSVAVTGAVPPGGDHAPVEIFVFVEQARTGADGARHSHHEPPGSRPVPAGFPYGRIRIAVGPIGGDPTGGDPTGREVDVTLVRTADLARQAAALRGHCLASDHDTALGRPSVDLLDALHALNRGRPVWGGHRLDGLRCRMGADFYPLVMTLIALDGAADGWRDLCGAAGDDLVTADASCRFTESAVDAVLAWYCSVTPQRRSRIAALRRLVDEQPGLVPAGDLYDALVPGRSGGRPSVEAAVQALRPLFDSPLLCTYPETRLLARELGEWP